MNTSNASTLKSPIAMPSYSTPKAVGVASNWLARVGSKMMAAMIENGEYRARVVLRNRNFY